MKRRPVEIDVSDHAVLRWLERAQGLDVAAIRRHIGGRVMNAAELAACAVVVEDVRFVLREGFLVAADGRERVVVSTVLTREQRRGLGINDGRGGADD